MNNVEIEKELKTLNDKFDSIKELITDNGIRTLHKQNKDLLVSSSCNVSGTIEELNSFTKRNNPSDSVFLFDITLCNSKPDRDNECFSVKSLYDMRSLVKLSPNDYCSYGIRKGSDYSGQKKGST